MKNKLSLLFQPVRERERDRNELMTQSTNNKLLEKTCVIDSSFFRELRCVSRSPLWCFDDPVPRGLDFYQISYIYIYI